MLSLEQVASVTRQGLARRGARGNANSKANKPKAMRTHSEHKRPSIPGRLARQAAVNSTHEKNRHSPTNQSLPKVCSCFVTSNLDTKMMYAPPDSAQACSCHLCTVGCIGLDSGALAPLWAANTSPRKSVQACASICSTMQDYT